MKHKTKSTSLFHQQLRTAAQPIWEAIFSHPFVRELGAGTLSRERFLFFVQQDYLYLQDFARTLCLGGAKGPTRWIHSRYSPTTRPPWSRWNATSTPTGATSSALPLKTWTTPSGHPSRRPTPDIFWRLRMVAAWRKSSPPSCRATGPIGRSERSSTPRPPTDPLYAEWTQAYSGEGFGAHVQQQLALIDRLAQDSSAGERKQWEAAFHPEQSV